MNETKGGKCEATTPLPEEWREPVLARFKSGERVLAWFAPDLDERLQFAEGLLILTDQRLLAFPSVQSKTGREWLLDANLQGGLRERAGLGTLELSNLEGRLGVWRFTQARGTGAHRLIERLEALKRDEPIDDPLAESIPCVSCGEPIPPGLAACPVCAPMTTTRPSASLLRLSRFAKPRALQILLGFVLTLAGTAMALVPPYLTIPLINRVLLPRQDFYLVKWYLLGLLGASLMAWLLSWAQTFVIAWVSERIAADLRVTTYGHLQCLSLEYFGGKRTGDLISRVSSDSDRICNFLSINLLDFGSDVIMIAMTSVLMFSMDPKLAIATLLPFPLITWLVYAVRRKIRRGLNRGSRAWAEMTSVLADTIPGIRVVKAFAQEDREVERFRKSNDYVLEANDRVNTTWSFFGPIINLLTQLGLLVVWAFGSWEVFEKSINVGMLVGFQFLIGRFYVRLESMIRFLTSMQRAANSTNRIFAILDRSPSVAEPTRPISFDRLRGEIEFRNVSFRHGSRSILNDINLKIRPGELVGLVGPSGAGKSTLVNLVCRFYDVAEGSILIDGEDVRSYGISNYRRNIGLVLQEPFLFYGTIAENIAYGCPKATNEEIITAARAAKCHDFILRLTDGYDSLVGERGQSLSGGERQRISIARALLIDPRILILDEATSSVDTETEREIQEALDNLIRGRTTIAIAHRLSTLRKADRLVVLERGRVVEVGDHHALLKRPGAYARLHNAQAELAAGTNR